MWGPSDAGLLANCIAGLPGLTDAQRDGLADACPEGLREEVRTRLRYVPPNRHALGTLREEVETREHPGEPRPLTDGDGRPWRPRLPRPQYFDEWLEDPPQLDPVLLGRHSEDGEDYGILRDRGLMYITGASKSGKSWLVDSLAISVASGTPWLGIPCQRGRVLLCDFELTKGSLNKRLRMILDYRQSLRGAPDYGSLMRNRLIPWSLRDYVDSLDNLYDDIVNSVRDMAYRDGEDPHGYIRMMVLDPLYMVEMGDENKASDMAALFRVVRGMQRELGCAVVIVHHHAKGASGGKAAIDRGAGSGAIGRNGDAILDVSRLFLDEQQQERINRRYEWAYRQAHGTDLACYRLTFAGIRDFMTPRPLDLVWTCPVHTIATAADGLAECDVVGTDAKAEVRSRQAARSEGRHERVNRVVGEALDACGMAGELPTKEAVYARCDWGDGEDVSKFAFYKFFEGKNRSWFWFRTVRVDGSNQYAVERIG